MTPPNLASPPAEEAPETNDPPKPVSGILEKAEAEKKWVPAIVLEQIPVSSRPQGHTKSPIPFFHILERLKTTKREGWRRFGIAHGESISDHMYRMSIMTMFAPPSLKSRVDMQKCMKMALVHDMAELLVGDITPADGVLKPEKSRRESITMDYLCEELLGNVDGGAQGRELREAWQEYEDSQTLESKFVHDIDKVELLLQMVDYERSKDGKVDLGEFTYVATRLLLPEVKEWSEQILAERDEYWQSLGMLPPHEQLSSKNIALQDEYYGGPAVNGKR
ncbi:MAG: hypothetical protein Q9162_001487 [Coniocarpon cinnabarinum]